MGINYVALLVFVGVLRTGAVSGQEVTLRACTRPVKPIPPQELYQEVQTTLRLANRRRRLSEELIKQLDAPQRIKRITAAYLLGLYRFENAATGLSAHLTLDGQAGIVATIRILPWGKYPAAEALGRIGKPAVPLMIKNLATTDDQLIRQLSAGVLISIEGKDVASFLLDQKMRDERDATRRKRLRSAGKLLRRIGKEN